MSLVKLKRAVVELELEDGTTMKMELHAADPHARAQTVPAGARLVEFRHVDFDIDTPVSELPYATIDMQREYAHTGETSWRMRLDFTDVVQRRKFQRGVR